MTQYWVRGHAGIGSNTDAGKSFWGIFNLQSSILDGIGSNTGVLDPISET